MEINYLQMLRDNPTKWGTDNMTIQPLSESAISSLEYIYNGGQPFPIALKELLFLAGNYCYVLDYGIEETREELQEYIRESLEENNKQMLHPFFAIDAYNGNDQFLFVYLNQGEDPAVYEALFYKDTNWFYMISPKLSTYISSLIERTKQGRNPF
ncbi:hypothetical protein GR160_13920 [Flavobacterium sp. Sd200]|uniref:hypothetical protein n=1 Tax=Flavobacterium sp. Sd200 TaxID=2692211 RepID=UPI0013709F7F|nr:hypothetical protein [Flavobacterium sp. Sd200]MXN92321.1 hypothetical protein [Flavobacterium sp. Sd200]